MLVRGPALLWLVGFGMSGCGSTPESAPVSDSPPAFGRNDAGVRDAGDADCAEETRNVYVISEQRSLYSFYPPTLDFVEIGTLRCAATDGATPSSMAVDRKGIAWVRYSDGSLWRVSTKTLSCSPSGFQPPASTTAAFYKFGMGFSSSAKGSSTEQLFLSDTLGAGLGRLDTGTVQVSFIGPFTTPLANTSAELTGTGDGKLYGFFRTEPAQVAEIAKPTGAILTTRSLPSVSPGISWAFSFYAGDFYIYTAAGNTLAGSNVTRYRPSDGSVTVVKAGIGFKIVGAGVSTCAPTEGPR